MSALAASLTALLLAGAFGSAAAAKDKPRPPGAAASAASAAAAASAANPKPPSDDGCPPLGSAAKIDINTATASELVTKLGIDAALARNIVRNVGAGYTSLQQLQDKRIVMLASDMACIRQNATVSKLPPAKPR